MNDEYTDCTHCGRVIIFEFRDHYHLINEEHQKEYFFCCQECLEFFIEDKVKNKVSI